MDPQLEEKWLAYGRQKPVKNDDLWKELDTQISQHNISWHWVKGHAGIEGNEKADALANRGMAAYK